MFHVYAIEEKYISSFEERVKWRSVGDRIPCEDKEDGILKVQQLPIDDLELGQYAYVVSEVYRDNEGEYVYETLWTLPFDMEVKQVFR